MKKLSLPDITLLVVAVCLILVLLPVLMRLRRSTASERTSRIPQVVTTTTLPLDVANDVGSHEASSAEAEVAEEEEEIPRPADGEKPILMY